MLSKVMSHCEFNFVVPADGCLNEIKSATHIDARDLFRDGRYSWVLQTYFLLRDAGMSVSLSNRADEAKINVSHARTLAETAATDAFSVCCNGDWPAVQWAHFQVIQNRLQEGRNAAWMPHWPQVGIMRRAADRDGVRTIGYCGRTDCMENFRCFGGMLSKHQLCFVVRGPDSWHDFSDIDVSVSLRFLADYRIRRKPPTKLINAWLAGVPFVAMDEPAFAQIGINGEDYLGVKRPEEVVVAVLKLRDDQELYQRLAENGRNKAQEYGWNATTRRWIDLLEGPITARYDLWKSRPRYEKARFRLLHTWWKMQQRMKKAIKRA